MDHLLMLLPQISLKWEKSGELQLYLNCGTPPSEVLCVAPFIGHSVSAESLFISEGLCVQSSLGFNYEWFPGVVLLTLILYFLFCFMGTNNLGVNVFTKGA